LLHESLQRPINEAASHLSSAATINPSLNELLEELFRLRRNGDSDRSAVYAILTLGHKLALIMAYLCHIRNRDFSSPKRVLDVRASSASVRLARFWGTRRERHEEDSWSAQRVRRQGHLSGLECGRGSELSSQQAAGLSY